MDVFVYPIPINGILNIASKKNIEAIKIFNIVGAEVYAQDEFEDSLNVSFLNSGVYFLQVQIEGQIVYKKIVKQ